MSLENVAPAANEPAPVEKIETAPAVVESAEVEHSPDNDPDGNSEEVDSEAQSSEPEWAEIEIDGKKYKVEAAAKDGYLRQSDYTRKTQEVAEQRRELEAKEQGFQIKRQLHEAVFDQTAEVKALDKRLAEYERVDWNTLYQTNPDLWHQHRFAREQLKEQRDAADRTLSEKKVELQDQANRKSGERAAYVQAELPKLIKDFTPEYGRKLEAYGATHGVSVEEITQAVLLNPKFAAILDKAYRADEASKKQKTQATFQKTQEAQPVTRVGGNSGAATRRTTDSSGDALSTEEWVRRETARVAAKNKR